MVAEFPNLESCDPRTCTNSMIRRCERVVAGIYRGHLSPFGITSSQLSILFVSAKRPGLTQVEMTTILKLEKSSLSRNLDRLLREGLVQKSMNRSISITDKGKGLLEKVIPAWERAKQEVEALLGDDGTTALMVLKQKLLEK